MNISALTDTNHIQAAKAFGYSKSVQIKTLGNGLINKTYLLQEQRRDAIVLQQLNTNVFQHPEDMQHNYLLIQEHLKNKNEFFFIPSLISTKKGEYLWKDSEGGIWRAMEFVPDTFSPELVGNTEDANAVALCFATFTASLIKLNASELKVIISDFHNLTFRYGQFTDAIQKDAVLRLNKAQWMINELQKRKVLVGVYESFSHETLFPTRIMHHDCKISNILFDCETREVICPVDLDTVMPGKFYSDIGDMIRTMCCSVEENSIDWDAIAISDDIYKAIIRGYLKGMGNHLTNTEKNHFHYAGLIMIYMQALRFLTDYLRGDVYYRVSYQDHNFNRAKNQLFLLQKLEIYLGKEYGLKSH
ncbi:MAG: phosphotransferase enzyme family protein [Chitinophagaceae bacterium]